MDFITPQLLQSVFSIGGGPLAFGLVSYVMWHNGPKQAITSLGVSLNRLAERVDALLNAHNELDKRTVRLETLADID